MLVSEIIVPAPFELALSKWEDVRENEIENENEHGNESADGTPNGSKAGASPLKSRVMELNRCPQGTRQLVRMNQRSSGSSSRSSSSETGVKIRFAFLAQPISNTIQQRTGPTMCATSHGRQRYKYVRICILIGWSGRWLG